MWGESVGGELGRRNKGLCRGRVGVLGGVEERS